MRTIAFLLLLVGMVGCKDSDCRSRVEELEQQVNRLKWEVAIAQVRNDACIQRINQLAEHAKLDFGFWVPTPALPQKVRKRE